jgi:hypothetical protein
MGGLIVNGRSSCRLGLLITKRGVELRLLALQGVIDWWSEFTRFRQSKGNTDQRAIGLDQTRKLNQWTSQPGNQQSSLASSTSYNKLQVTSTSRRPWCCSLRTGSVQTKIKIEVYHQVLYLDRICQVQTAMPPTWIEVLIRRGRIMPNSAKQLTG